MYIFEPSTGCMAWPHKYQHAVELSYTNKQLQGSNKLQRSSLQSNTNNWGTWGQSWGHHNTCMEANTFTTHWRLWCRHTAFSMYLIFDHFVSVFSHGWWYSSKCHLSFEWSYQGRKKSLAVQDHCWGITDHHKHLDLCSNHIKSLTGHNGQATICIKYKHTIVLRVWSTCTAAIEISVRDQINPVLCSSIPRNSTILCSALFDPQILLCEHIHIGKKIKLYHWRSSGVKIRRCDVM